MATPRWDGPHCAPPPVVGHVGNKYSRAYWTNGPELSVMMLRYFDYTQDIEFARNEMMPIADAVLDFWFSHFPVVEGRLLLRNDRCDEVGYLSIRTFAIIRAVQVL